MRRVVVRAITCGRRGRPRFDTPSEEGYSLIELMFVSSLLAVIAAAAIPQSLVMVDRSRAVAAARYVAARMSQARIAAVSRSATVALRFEPGSRGTIFRVFVDGNRNGVRTRDIRSGIDWQIEDAVLLSDLFPGVSIGLLPSLGDEAVQLGGGDLLSFTATGTSSSGSIYIRGRDDSQFAVRVLGATGRARVLHYDRSRSEWIDGAW